MAENDSQQNTGKKNWSLVESVLSSKTSVVPAPVQGAGTHDADIVPATHSSVSPPVIIPRPDLLASQGILARLKSNKMGRKAALEQLQEQYNGQLDCLKESITQAVKVHKTKVGVAAEEYLEETRFGALGSADAARNAECVHPMEGRYGLDGHGSCQGERG